MSPLTIAVPMILLMGIFFLFSKRKIYLNFREGRPEDLTRLQELALISYAEFENILDPERFHLFKQSLKSDELWEKLMQKSLPFLCEDYNKIVGMIFFFPGSIPDDIFESGQSYIRLLGVHPDYRGKGIAKKLTQMCIDAALETNEHAIALHTSENMAAAKHIYVQLGFKEVKEIAPRFGQRYFIYLKNLDDRV